jgi:hypothetical protein
LLSLAVLIVPNSFMLTVGSLKKLHPAWSNHSAIPALAILLTAYICVRLSFQNTVYEFIRALPHSLRTAKNSKPFKSACCMPTYNSRHDIKYLITWTSALRKCQTYLSAPFPCSTALFVVELLRKT